MDIDDWFTGYLSEEPFGEEFEYEDDVDDSE